MAGLSNIRLSSPLTTAAMVASDGVAIASAGVVAYLAYFGWDSASTLPVHYSTLIMLAVLLKLGVSTQLYQSWRGGALGAMLSRVAMGWVMSWMLLLAWLVLSKTAVDYSRVWLVTWAGLGLLMLIASRLLLYASLRFVRARGFNRKQLLLVGDADAVSRLRRRLSSSTWTGFQVVAGLDYRQMDEISAVAQRTPLDEVWISLNASDRDNLAKLLDGPLRHSSANVRLVPDLFTLPMLNQGVSIVLGYPMIDLFHSPMFGINALVKALEDRLFAVVALVLFSPVMVGLAVMIKLSSPGPVLYGQQRVSWNGRTFQMLKFRSMTVDAEANGVEWGGSARKNVTRIGAFMRRTSLDELPQFFNVLRGDMSIVGPRPERPVFVEQFKEEIPRYMRKHMVKAGITGWAQVNGWRGDTDLQQRIDHDLYYIENWSLWLDLRIIFTTPFRGLIHKNAK